VPSVGVERRHGDADLFGEMNEHARSEFVPMVGKASVVSVERELREEPEAPRLLLVEEQILVARLELPLLKQLLRRPQPLHRSLSIPLGRIRRAGPVVHRSRCARYRGREDDESTGKIGLGAAFR